MQLREAHLSNGQILGRLGRVEMPLGSTWWVSDASSIEKVHIIFIILDSPSTVLAMLEGTLN
jgi:hypothetical protein